VNPPRAVLFDFSTTLFHVDTGERLLAPVLSRLRPPLSPDEQAALRARLDGVLAGGGWPRALRAHQWPAGVTDAWSRRHLHPAAHRAPTPGCCARRGCHAASCPSCRTGD